MWCAHQKWWFFEEACQLCHNHSKIMLTEAHNTAFNVIQTFMTFPGMGGLIWELNKRDYMTQVGNQISNTLSHSPLLLFTNSIYKISQLAKVKFIKWHPWGNITRKFCCFLLTLEWVINRLIHENFPIKE